MAAPSRYFVESDGNTIFDDHYNSEFNNIIAGMIPRNFTAFSTNTTLWQNSVSPGAIGSESLPTTTSGEIQRLKHQLKLITGKTYPYSSPSITLTQAYPVGSIISFYDFNAAVSYDTNVYLPCNGAVVADATSPLNGKTLPNLSGRYIVGFGTDGGADLGSATFNTTTLGNSTRDLAHTHTVGTHKHTYGHTHGADTLQFAAFATGFVFPTFFVYGYDSGGGAASFVQSSIQSPGTANPLASITLLTGSVAYTKNGAGDTGSTSSDTGTTSLNTASSLSSVQDIRPSSVRVRYLMRYK